MGKVRIRATSKTETYGSRFSPVRGAVCGSGRGSVRAFEHVVPGQHSQRKSKRRTKTTCGFSKFKQVHVDRTIHPLRVRINAAANVLCTLTPVHGAAKHRALNRNHVCPQFCFFLLSFSFGNRIKIHLQPRFRAMKFPPEERTRSYGVAEMRKERRWVRWMCQQQLQ